MYGLVIEGIRFMLAERFGPEVMEKVLQKCQLQSQSFSTHERYSEKMVPNVLTAACEVTGESMENMGILAGRYFVHFVLKNGYGPLLQVMGRRYGDFLKGLDNLHEYFRFSYPKIRPPSFYCSKESTGGLILHYRSRRVGYISYVMGQLIEVAKTFFNTDIAIQVTNKQQKGSFQFVVMKINFDNIGLDSDRKLKEKSSSLNEFLPVDSMGFLSMFPYFIAFNKKLQVNIIGVALRKIMPHLTGQIMEEQFDLQRPCIKFTWDGCMAHLNCMFQMESLYPIQKKAQKEKITFKVNDLVEDKIEVPEGEEEEAPAHPESQAGEGEEQDEELPYLQVRGPMVYLKHCEMMIYLPTVVIEKLDNLFQMGLYLDDYGDADCNKEIIMATVQKSDDLKDLLKTEKERSVMLAGMMKEIDASKRKARDLLSTMMPKEVANELLMSGECSTVSNTFNDVTIAFAKVCDFLQLTYHLPAVEVVNLLNSIYSCFDEIITRHGVYKVETIGESYMISCGVPYTTEFHAEYIGDTSLDMIASVKNIDFGGLKGKKIQMKIGIYSGPCVGGVVGKRAPRFCLFGDTVNCASRMESHNKQAMTIQLGQHAKDMMDKAAPQKFKFKHRGLITLKGKGEMKAFGLIGKAGRPRYQTDPIVIPDEEADEREIYTPIDEGDHDRASTMSRMSIGKISQSSSRSVSSMSSTGEDKESLAGLTQQQSEMSNPSRRATPDGSRGRGNQMNQVISGASVAKRLVELESEKENRFNVVMGSEMGSLAAEKHKEAPKKAKEPEKPAEEPPQDPETQEEEPPQVPETKEEEPPELPDSQDEPGKENDAELESVRSGQNNLDNNPDSETEQEQPERPPVTDDKEHKPKRRSSGRRDSKPLEERESDHELRKLADPARRKADEIPIKERPPSTASNTSTGSDAKQTPNAILAGAQLNHPSAFSSGKFTLGLPTFTNHGEKPPEGKNTKKEAKQPEKPPVENKKPEKKPVEKKEPEKPSVEDKKTEKKPVEKKEPEKPSVEDKKTEKKPVEKKEPEKPTARKLPNELKPETAAHVPIQRSGGLGLPNARQSSFEREPPKRSNLTVEQDKVKAMEKPTTTTTKKVEKPAEKKEEKLPEKKAEPKKKEDPKKKPDSATTKPVRQESADMVQSHRDMKKLVELQKSDSLNSSDSKDSLLEKAPLPPITENGSVTGATHEQDCNGSLPDCKCSKIRGNMKLKTKVCSLIQITRGSSRTSASGSSRATTAMSATDSQIEDVPDDDSDVGSVVSSTTGAAVGNIDSKGMDETAMQEKLRLKKEAREKRHKQKLQGQGYINQEERMTVSATNMDVIKNKHIANGELAK